MTVKCYTSVSQVPILTLWKAFICVITLVFTLVSFLKPDGAGRQNPQSVMLKPFEPNSASVKEQAAKPEQGGTITANTTTFTVCLSYDGTKHENQ